MYLQIILCVGSYSHFHHLWICYSISFLLCLQVVLKDLCTKTNGHNSPVLSILYEHRGLDEDDYKAVSSFLRKYQYNAKLRAGMDLSDVDEVKRMSRLIEEAEPLDHDVYVYRGIRKNKSIDESLKNVNQNRTNIKNFIIELENFKNKCLDLLGESLYNRKREEYNKHIRNLSK